VLLGRHEEKRLSGAFLFRVFSERAGSACPSVYGVLVMGHEVAASWTLLVLELDLSFRCVKVIELGRSGLVLFLSGWLFAHECSLII